MSKGSVAVAPTTNEGPASPRVDRGSFRIDQEEVLKHCGQEVEDTAAHATLSDRVFYGLENIISVLPSFPFYLLLAVSAVLIFVLGLGWSMSTGEDVLTGFYTAFQVIASGGNDDSLTATPVRIVYFFMVFSGLCVFSIFVGFITDYVSEFMTALSAGRTKVCEHGHTLLLGWNEATPRLVCQLAFLRRAWRVQNETWAKRLLPWRRVPPSTPVAAARIVLLSDPNDKHSPDNKQAMDEALQEAFDERGILPSRTRIGWDVVCRTGDPTCMHDLLRVGARQAGAIVFMLTEKDEEGDADSGGYVLNGGTIAGLLTLRHLLLSADGVAASLREDRDLRVIVQLTAPSVHVEAASFCNVAGRAVVQCLDLSVSLNSLLFSCAATPGLASVLLELLNFEGVALRTRAVGQLVDHAGVVGGLAGRTFAEAAASWEDAVLVGVCAGVGDGGGLAADPERRIAANDRLIFVAPTSMPSSAHTPEQPHAPASDPGARAARSPGARRQVDILVCGWRDKWQAATPEHLFERIDDLAQTLTPGPATVVFLNQVPPDEFAAIMQQKFKQVNDYHGMPCWSVGKARKGVTIAHSEGDASSQPVLEPLITTHNFTKCIVLGTMYGNDLSSHWRDLRMLSIMLLLRHLTENKPDASPIHIIGENQEDMTQRLALAPRPVAGRGGDGHIFEPDIVNTQAIIARALCQSVAFPRATAAIQELFKDAPGTACIVICPAAQYLRLGTPVSFATIQARVLADSGHRELCIGFTLADGKHELAPPRSHVQSFSPNDRLVLVSRIPREDAPSKSGRKAQKPLPPIVAARAADDEAAIPAVAALPPGGRLAPLESAPGNP